MSDTAKQPEPPEQHNERAVIVVLFVLVALIACPILFLSSGTTPTELPPEAVPDAAASAAPEPTSEPSILPAEVRENPAEAGPYLTKLFDTADTDPLELRKAARAVAHMGPQLAPLLIGLLKTRNHPELFEAVGALGEYSAQALPYLDSLLRYLDETCSDERVGQRDGPQEQEDWRKRRVFCSEHAKIRKGAQDAWIAISQSKAPRLPGIPLPGMTDVNQALVIAARRERLGTVKKLLASGAFVNAIVYGVEGDEISEDTARPVTPLIAATASGSTTMCDLLLLVGGDVNARPWFPLNEAVRLGNVAMVDYLLEHGSEVNRQDGDGEYPLTLAVQAGNLAAAEKLIAAGANPFLRNAKNKSARELAIGLGNADVLGALKTS